MKDGISVWHLPENGSNANAYGRLLTRELASAGVSVLPVPYAHVFALRALRGRPDALHFEFITPFLLPALAPESVPRALAKGTLFLAQIAALRLLGCRVVWTLHNASNHEARLPRLERFFSVPFARLTTAFVAHGERARDEAARTFFLDRGDPRFTVFPHPTYEGAYPNDVPRPEARRRLGIDPAARVLLCFGMVRAYKGIEELLDEFETVRREGVELWIVGAPEDTALAERVARRCAVLDGVHFKPEFIPDDQVQLYFNACDVVVMPYRQVLTSGAAPLSMSFARPIVAPTLGCLGEVLDPDGAFLYGHDDPDGLARALERAFAAEPEELARRGRHNRRKAAAWTWSNAVERLIPLYASAERAASHAGRAGAAAIPLAAPGADGD